MKVYRLEFWQPDGRWTGPYTAEYMTKRAFDLQDEMLKDHKISRPFPASITFAENPGLNRYVCASASLEALNKWSGQYIELFQQEAGHIGVYEVPETAIAEHDEQQVVYQQKQAVLIKRDGIAVNPKTLIERFHPQKIRSNNN